MMRFERFLFAGIVAIAAVNARAAAQAADEYIAPSLGLAFEEARPFLVDAAEVEVRVSAALSDDAPRVDRRYRPTLARMAEQWGLVRLAPDGEGGRLVYDVREAALTDRPLPQDGFFAKRFSAPDRLFEARIVVEIAHGGAGPDRRRIRSVVTVTGALEVDGGSSLEERDAAYARFLRDLAQDLDRRMGDVMRVDFRSLLD